MNATIAIGLVSAALQAVILSYLASLDSRLGRLESEMMHRSKK